MMSFFYLTHYIFQQIYQTMTVLINHFGAKYPVLSASPDVTFVQVIGFKATLHPWWISSSIFDLYTFVARGHAKQHISLPRQYISRRVTTKKFLLQSFDKWYQDSGVVLLVAEMKNIKVKQNCTK